MKNRLYGAVVFTLLLTNAICTQTPVIAVVDESVIVDDSSEGVLLDESNIEKHNCEKFSMVVIPILPPEKNQTPVIKPDPNIDYKMKIINPCPVSELNSDTLITGTGSVEITVSPEVENKLKKPE